MGCALFVSASLEFVERTRAVRCLAAQIDRSATNTMTAQRGPITTKEISNHALESADRGVLPLSAVPLDY